MLCKIILDKMKDQSIAKLCAQCEEFYTETAKIMEREPIMMSLDKEWTANVNIIMCLRSITIFTILKIV